MDETTLTDEQKHDTQRALQQLTGVSWVFTNGILRVIEQSEAFQKQMPGILEKLKRLNEKKLITGEMTGEGADRAYEITDFDFKGLEKLAADEMRNGIATLTDLDFSYDDGSDDDGINESDTARRPRLSFKGPVTPAQLSRLYRLMAKNILSIRLIERAEETRAIKAEVEVELDLDLKDVKTPQLNAEAESEPARRTQGPEAASALSAVTGAPWVWDGISVVLAVPPEKVSAEAFERLNQLSADGVLAYAFESPDGAVSYAGFHVTDIDIARLRTAARPAFDEARELLNQMAARPNKTFFQPNGTGIYGDYPQDAQDDNAFQTTLNDLARKNAIQWKPQRSPLNDRIPGAQITTFNLDELRIAQNVKEEAAAERVTAATAPETPPLAPPPGGGKWSDYSKDPNRATTPPFDFRRYRPPSPQ